MHLELAQVVDHTLTGDNNRYITFDIEVSNGQIQMTLDSLSEHYMESITSLVAACGLEPPCDYQTLHHKPFLVKRDMSKNLHLFEIRACGELPS